LRANAGRVAEHPRRLATVAVATAGVAGLITAVTWAAVIGATEHRTASADADVLATPGPVAGALPDSERGVSRGSESHDLDAGAAPAAAPPGHTVADDDPEAAAVTPRTFVVVSRPVGATVSLNGEHLGESSPVSIEVLPGERYTLRLEKSGFEPLSWAFSLEELSASHRQSGELYFPLQPSPQPGDEEELDVAPGVALARVMPTATESAATSSEPTDPFGFPGGPPPSPTNIRRVRAPAEAPAPEKLHHVEPTLPANVTVAGVVVLEIEVSARGNVVQAKVLRSLDPLADRAALDAVVRWKYRPTQLSGTPVHVVMTVTLPMRHSR
jgi:TonB family protein